jgi:hypothetical protein
MPANAFPFLLVVFCATVMLMLQFYPAWLLSTIIKWALYIMAGFEFGLGVWTFFYALKFFGPETWARRNRMVELDVISDNPVSYFNYWTRLFGVVITLSAVLLQTRWLCLGVYLSCHFLERSTQIHVPTFVLLLSSSKPSTTTLNTSISLSMNPLQTTHFTRIAKQRTWLDSMTQHRTRRLVTDAATPWLTIVKELMHNAKVIVLDTRDLTAHVLEEAAVLRDSGYSFKSILIVDSTNARHPSAILEVDATEFAGAALVSENQVLPLLSVLKHDPTSLPTASKPMSVISSALAIENNLTD